MQRRSRIAHGYCVLNAVPPRERFFECLYGRALRQVFRTQGRYYSADIPVVYILATIRNAHRLNRVHRCGSQSASGFVRRTGNRGSGRCRMRSPARPSVLPSQCSIRRRYSFHQWQHRVIRPEVHGVVAVARRNHFLVNFSPGRTPITSCRQPGATAEATSVILYEGIFGTRISPPQAFSIDHRTMSTPAAMRC